LVDEKMDEFKSLMDKYSDMLQDDMEGEPIAPSPGK
jgi:hypothetical protein